MDITLRSQQQILGTMIGKMASETDLTDFSAGSSILTALEAAASSDFSTEGKLLRILNIRNIDKAQGIDLDNLADELGVAPGRIGAASARVLLTVSETAFTKVYTNVYAGATAPTAGDTTVKVIDASKFNPTGTLYIARGTGTFERVPYTSLTSSGSYWTINLASPLIKDHLVGEQVVMAQGGDREVPAGTIAQVAASNGAPAVQFKTLVSYTMLDGEDSLANVEAVAVTPGTSGNVGINKIKDFQSRPWSTATVTNPNASAGGIDPETDDQFRQRIKDWPHTLGKATSRSISRAMIGVSDPNEGKRVVSAFYRAPTAVGDAGTLFIDDGTGYAPPFEGIGQEVLVSDADGIESFFQLQNWPIAKAQIATIGMEPFSLSGGEYLTVEVDGISESQPIPGNDFRTPGIVSAQEVAEAINGQYSDFKLIEARAKDGRLYITPVKSEADYIAVNSTQSESDANTFLRFPTRRSYTIRLYKNDVLLNKNGKTATIQSNPRGNWPVMDGSAATPDAQKPSLQLKVDGITSPVITFSDSDFLSYSSASTVGTATVADWVKVLNNRLIGITATADSSGTALLLSSNRGANTSASIEVVGGTLAGKMFPAVSKAKGQSVDFTLNSLLGQITLSEKLTKGDQLKAGTVNTRGFALSSAQSSFNIMPISGQSPEMIVITGDPVEIVLFNQTGTATLSIPSTGVQRITASAGAFTNVNPNDMAHLYNVPAGATSGVYRVQSVATNGSYVDLLNPAPGSGSVTLDGVNNKLQFFRSNGLPQRVIFDTGTNVPSSDIASNFNTQLDGVTATISDSGSIQLATTRYDSSGALSICSAAGNAMNLGFKEGSYRSGDPHTASLESADLMGMPTSRVSIPNANADTSYPFQDVKAGSSVFSSRDYANRGLFQYYGAASGILRQPKERVSTSEVTLRNENPAQIVGMGADYRGVAMSGPEFGQADNMVLLIDNNPAQMTFDIPMYVDATVCGPSVPSSSQFDAKDATGALLGSSSRWAGHRFDDYRVWAQARGTLPANVANGAIKVQAVPYGPVGENVNVGIFYPSSGNQPAQVKYSVDALTSKILLQIFLKSSTERPINIQPNQPITVAVSGTGPYTNKVTFVTPVDLSSVVPGDILSLSDPAFSLANRKSWQVTSVSNLYDSTLSFQFPTENVTADVNGGTSITLSVAPQYTVMVGDKVRLAAFNRTITSVYNSVSSSATAVAANQITVAANQAFTTTGGSISVGSSSFTYTAYNTSTGVLSGVSPNPVGTVNVGNTVTQSKKEVVVSPGVSFASTGSFQVGAITFSYNSYNSTTGVFSGITPDPVGVITAGDVLYQSISNGAETTVATVTSSTAFTVASAFTDGSGKKFVITHKAMKASSAPTFVPQVGDKVQVGGQVHTIQTVLSSSSYLVDNTFTFSGVLSGVISRVNLVGNSITPGVSETIFTSSSSAVRSFVIPTAGNEAKTLIDLANGTAGVSDLVTFSNAGSSTGEGIHVSSTEDVTGSSAYVSLVNGESYVKSVGTGSPAITVKEAFGTSLELGDKLRFVPATARNVADHFSRKQITGLTVAANVDLVGNGTKVQISSKTPGASGQVFAIGGRASGQTVLSLRGNPQELSSSIGQLELDRAAVDMATVGGVVKIYQPGQAKKQWITAPTVGQTISINASSGNPQLHFPVQVAPTYGYTHTSSVTWIVRKIGKDRTRFEILSGTATIPSQLKADDWVRVGGSYAGISRASFFATGNQGWWQVRETDNSTYFDVEGSGVDETVIASSFPFIFAPYHSAQVGDSLVLGANLPLSSVNKGTFIITSVIDANTVTYSNEFAETVSSATLSSADAIDSLKILDRGYSTYRKVVLMAPKPNDPTNRSVVVVSPGYNLSLFNEGQGAKMSFPNRLGFGTDPVPGMDGYQYWTGLKQTAQRVLDGYEPDPDTYPGYRSAGVPIEVREPRIKRLAFSFAVKTSKGVGLQSISDSIKSAVAGYVNSLGLGQDVVMSEIISLIQGVSGVESVLLVYPSPSTERVSIGSYEISRVASGDITLSG